MSLDAETIVAYWPALVGVAKRMLPRASHAVWEDIAGDTVERAFRNRDRYTELGSGPHAWLMTMASRIALDYTRRRVNTPTLPLDDYRNGTADAGSDRHADMLDVGAALAQASARDRTLLEAHYRDGVKLQAIEGIAHYSKGNTSKSHTKALARLRPALEVLP